jgi:hypothetical protein
MFSEGLAASMAQAVEMTSFANAIPDGVVTAPNRKRICKGLSGLALKWHGKGKEGGSSKQPR